MREKTKEELSYLLRDAAQSDEVKVIRSLLKKGAEPLAKLRSWDDSEKDWNWFSALDHACMRGNLASAEAMIDHLGRKPFIGYENALQLSVTYGQKDLLLLFRDIGMDLNAIVGRWTLLIHALYQDHASKGGGRVRMLLEAGVNPEVPDKLGYTPIHHAAMRVNAEGMRLLLEAGCEFKGLYEGLPLLARVCRQKNFSEETARCIDLLLDKKLDAYDPCDPVIHTLGAKKAIGTPLPFLLVQEGHLDAMRHLLARGAVDANMTVPEGMKLPAGLPLLYHAAENEQVAMFDVLADAGADVFGPCHRDGKGLSFYECAGPGGKAHITSQKTIVTQELQDWMSQGAPATGMVEEGKPARLLRRCCAYGLLPELADAERWEGREAEGMELWRALYRALPPYWRGRMEPIDTVALEALGKAETKGHHFQQMATKPRLQTETRR